MDKNARRQRKNDLRKERRNKARQDSLISEYIRVKYANIYIEAAEFYNSLNRKYATKHDLKRTLEFRVWKANITGETVKHPRKTASPCYRSPHPDIPFQNLEPVEVNPQAQFVVTCVELPSEQTSDMGNSQPSSPDTQPSSPDPATPDTQPSSPDPSSPDTQPSSPDPATPDTREIRRLIPVKLPAGKRVYEDTLQLRIPLIPHKTISTPVITEKDSSEEHPPVEPTVTPETSLIPHKTITTPVIIEEDSSEEHPPVEPTVTAETLQIITEETVGEGTIQPSLMEDLEPELIEKVISELLLEPDLQDIFTDIERQLEFEQLGMDIDIPIEDSARGIFELVKNICISCIYCIYFKLYILTFFVHVVLLKIYYLLNYMCSV